MPLSARDVEGPIFFTEHEWHTIEAAPARIIATDYHPGARGTKVLGFIDRMLEGTQFIFPAAAGRVPAPGGPRRGRLEGAHQATPGVYREGVVELDHLAKERDDGDFIELSE